MKASILFFALSIHCCLAGESHTIPIEGYETKLQVLGQHVDIPETPVKIIKITKTIAVKIPVPYPVKVREKVPYPVHVSKPYPVPVPQIIKVPHIVKVHDKAGHDGGGWQGGAGHDGGGWQGGAGHDSGWQGGAGHDGGWQGGADQGGGGGGGDFGSHESAGYSHDESGGFSGYPGHEHSRTYQVQEQNPGSGPGQDYSGYSENYEGGPVSHNRVGNDDHYGENSFSGGADSHSPTVGAGDFSVESKNYDDAIKSYYNKQSGNPNPGLDNHQVYNVESANIDHIRYGHK